MNWRLGATAQLVRSPRPHARPGHRPPPLERALAIRERVLGPDHPDTVATGRALAGEEDGPGAGG